SSLFENKITGFVNIAYGARTIGTYERVNQLLVDLTDLFGEGFEPTKEEFEKLLNNFPNNWFDTQNQFNTVQKYILRGIVKGNKDVPPPSNLLQTVSRTTDKNLRWYDTTRKIIYAVDNVPNLDAKKLYASY